MTVSGPDALGSEGSGFEVSRPDGAQQSAVGDARGAAALEMAARLRRRQEAESAHAAQLVAAFAQQALAAGITTERLTARSYSGGARYRTNIAGWYLKRDRSIGVGEDGMFYILQAPGGIGSRVRGVTLTPAEPPLELGKGGRDGESMPMADALAKRLAGGNSWAK